MGVCSAAVAVENFRSGMCHKPPTAGIVYWNSSQVELRFVKKRYCLRLGDKVSVVTRNAMPVLNMPCLSVGNDVLEMVRPFFQMRANVSSVTLLAQLAGWKIFGLM